MENLTLFIFLALLAEILGTVGGFGSSLFFVPIASYFLDFYSVLGITALFHVSSNITKIVFFRKGFDKKLVLSIGIPAIGFVIIGGVLSKYIPTQLLEIGLAIFLITISLTLLIFKSLKVKPTIANSIIGGTASGLFAGLLGTGGAIRGITLAAFSLKTEVFIATSAVIDLGIDASRSFVYYFNGYIHKEDLYLIPILLIVSIVGTYIGKQILAKISDKQFKSIVLVLILITGLITLYKII
ncbi:sulfite exporter TauE/SafE family protein [Vicingus serpentipes]|uniref:Probable membrane transporter protein n=1 Tax=Vicingus serpentipes TaxID=1926625 RepID=A0A5C6RRH8_9FLAO|nr:sulfite exporter TauE/SafE family protein [Vicingus serpentipes]TXB64564.1 sulfite exporter TauE/SafE family protein [Vicingus serpentipes]